MFSVLKTNSNRSALETVHEGKKYDIKKQNGPLGVLGPKLQKINNYLYEVPKNSDEVCTIGLPSQVKKVISLGDNIFTMGYLSNNTTLWLDTLNISSTSIPYILQIGHIPDPIKNENKLTIYMKATPKNQLTNYAKQFIINDISYTIFWENGLFPDLTLDCNPDCTESIVKQECTFLPSFGEDRFIVTCKVTIYGI